MAVCLAVSLLTGCHRKIEPISKSGFLLNTFVTVTLYDNDDPKILKECLDLCRSYENIFSKTIESSEVYKINHRSAQESSVKLSPDMAALLSKGFYYPKYPMVILMLPLNRCLPYGTLQLQIPLFPPRMKSVLR